MTKIEQVKQYRDVIVPETITVQELANRMSERGGDVIFKSLDEMVDATINQSIDADTAELIILEFGHRIKRVTEADVEIGIDGEADDENNLVSRPPVVTIMGHVDYGKTSLLDALRRTELPSPARLAVLPSISELTRLPLVQYNHPPDNLAMPFSNETGTRRERDR